MKILSSLYWVCTQDILFGALESQQRYRETLFVFGEHMFNVFVSTCALAFLTTHGKNNMRKYDTEGLVPVASLCGIVGSSS